MAEKYFTVSYDDGVEQDQRIIALMEKYGIKGTFNIGSGLFGEKTIKTRKWDSVLDGPMKQEEITVRHFILEREEALRLYASPNVEIASHGIHHLHQETLSPEEAAAEIYGDIDALSDMFGYQVVGHAFPYGTYNDTVLDILKAGGVRYARTTTHHQEPVDFSFDRNSLLLIPTCWQLEPFTESLLDRFLSTPPGDEDMVFYMWGHGYELDYGTERGNYDYLERLFAKVARAGDIRCVTNRELYGA